MKKPIVIEQEFHRQAGPREMYGWVKILGQFGNKFALNNMHDWPTEYDEERYINAIRGGILAAFQELNIKNPFGNFEILEARFSSNGQANVPFAYKEAAKRAAVKIAKEWTE